MIWDQSNQSFQSQTCFRKCSMLTFFDFISTIHGCSSIRHGVARLDASFSRLDDCQLLLHYMSQHNGRRIRCLPAFDEVLETFTPLDSRLGLVLEFRDGLPDNVGQEVNQPSLWVHLCPIRREGEAMLGHFKESHTE